MNNNSALKFFVPPALKREGFRPMPMLYRLWGGGPTDRTPYLKEIYQDYHYDSSLFELVDSVEEADFVLMPYRYNVVKAKEPSLFKDYVTFARNTKKPLFVDGTGDIEYPIDIKDVYVLRSVGYKSLGVPKNDIHMPIAADDLLERFYNGKLTVRQKTSTPSVSFAGWAKMPFIRRIKRYIKEAPFRILGIFDSRYRTHVQGVFFRLKAIKYLKQTQGLISDFLIRSSYSGHVTTSEKDMDELRREFVENIHDNDYALCVRGDSNISVRIYEALSLGRIPLQIDTDCVYPFEDEIDYREFCVLVDFRNLKSSGEILKEFHKNISNEKFESMQRRAREVYLTYMRPDRFPIHLFARLRKIAEGYR